jgi:hypothetical protein
MPPAAVPGAGKKQKSGSVKTVYEDRFGYFYARLSAEEKAELHAFIAERFKKYGVDPNGNWLWAPLPEQLLRDVYGAAWNTVPIDDHWKWKYDELFQAHTALVVRRKRLKKGANVNDEDSAPSRKRAKQLASQARWRQAFDSEQEPRGAMLEVEDRVVEDLRRQFPQPQDFPDADGAQGRTPACCMHSGQ